MAEIATLPEDVTGLVRSLVNEGRVAAEAGRLRDAEQAFARALAIDPDDAGGLIDYGRFLIETKNFVDGRKLTERAMRLPNLTPVQTSIGWNNIGTLNYKERRLYEALPAFEKSIEIDPWYKVAIVNLGAACVVAGDYDRAYDVFDQAALVAPGDFEPMWNKAIVRMTQGDWVNGLPGYETRKVENEKLWPVPRWRGEDLTGKCILAWAEQGFGDCIWAHRLVRQLIPKAAKVCLNTYTQLEPILPVDGIQVVREGDTIECLHYQVPVMSLLYGLRIRPSAPPAPAGIAPPHPDVRRRWSFVKQEGKLNVGISWSGNLNHKFDDLRTIPCRALEVLWSGLDESVAWHSLQKDSRPCDGDALAASPIRFYGEEIKDFADAAAIAEQMDLIISVDTAALHLSAEMGRPTWGLIPHSPDFRWGLSGADSPWYPTLKLYRKDTPLGSWLATLERVRRDLEKLL